MKYTVEQIIEQDEIQRQLDWNEQPYVEISGREKITQVFQNTITTTFKVGEDILDNFNSFDSFSCPPDHTRIWFGPNENGIMSYEDIPHN